MTLNPKNIDLTWFLAAKEWITTKWMEIDYDYLRTGTAIGFRTSRELCSNYLLKMGRDPCFSPTFKQFCGLFFYVCCGVVQIKNKRFIFWLAFVSLANNGEKHGEICILMVTVSQSQTLVEKTWNVSLLWWIFINIFFVKKLEFLIFCRL